MNSRDRDNLIRLTESQLDGKLEAGESSQLEGILQSSAEARRIYHDCVALHAELYWREWGMAELREFAGELSATSRHGPADPSAWGVVKCSIAEALARPAVLSIGIGAIVMFVLLTTLGFISAPIYKALSRDTGDIESVPYVAVAQLTGSRDVIWRKGHATDVPLLQKGHKIELSQGFAEITYGSGAVVVIQGPAQYVVEGEMSGFLQSGRLMVQVREESAKGFAINTPLARVEDFGTEFGVYVDDSGASEAIVFEGLVTFRPNSKKSSESRAIKLNAGEAARLEHQGAPIIRLVRTADFASLAAASNQFALRRNHASRTYERPKLPTYIGEGTYDENVVNTNTVDIDAPGFDANGSGATQLTVTGAGDFDALVASAFVAGNGGVGNFDGTSMNPLPAFNISFDSGNKFLLVTRSGATFGRTSDAGQISGNLGYHDVEEGSSFVLGDITSLPDGGGSVLGNVGAFGFTLSRRPAFGAASADVTFTFSDGSTAIVSGSTEDNNDVFFGVQAPIGEHIESFRLDNPAGNTGFFAFSQLDDFGFVEAGSLTSSTVPEPSTFAMFVMIGFVVVGFGLYRQRCGS